MIKVFIENFELVEEAKIVIDGLVSLVGESNNGKTAVYNALKVLTYNIQGTQYIRRVQGKNVIGGCRVGMQFADTNASVVFSKIDSPVYTLEANGSKNVFEKAGRGPTPESVALVLNMLPLDIEGLDLNLNFCDQFAEPLIRKLSDYQIYKVAVKSFDGEKIQEAILLARQDSDVKANEYKVKQIEIETQKRNKLAIMGSITAFTELLQYKAMFAEYDKMYRTYTLLSGLKNRLDEVNASIAKINRVSELLSNVDDMVSTINRMREVANMHSRLVTLIDRRVIVDANMRKANERDQLFIAFDSNEAVYTEYIQTRITLGRLLDLYNRWMTLKQDMSYVEEQNSILSELTPEFLNNVQRYSFEGERLTKGLKIANSYKTVNDRILGLLQVDKMLVDLPDMKKFNADFNKLQQLKNLNDRYKNMVSGIKQREEVIIELDEQIHTCQHMIDDNVCPTCGTKIKQ